MELTLFAVVPFLLALLSPTLYNMGGKRTLIYSVCGALAVMFIGGLLQLPRITDGEILQYTLEWAPQIDLQLTFYLDGLSLLFVSLVTGIGVAVFYYAGYYFDDDAETLRFYRMLLMFTGAMLWLVTAGNLLALFIAWELTSITSFMLIGFKGAKSEDARQGALQALMVTGAGGLTLVVGLLLISAAVGSMEFSEILNTDLSEHPYYIGIVILVGLGAFTKSAQFPFHFWLPGAMSAPSPASAFLHSATMVKAGVYLLARLYPSLGTGDLWLSLLPAVGLVTFLIASLLAVRQRDLKGLLAFTTIAQLGTLVALIGLPDYAGFKALMVGILAHALYKAPLFLSAGIIDHATGTRIVDRLGGLRGKMPTLSVVVALACISMAGVIPFLGFVGKEVLLEAFIDNQIALGVIVVSAALTVAVALILFWDVFMRPAADPEAIESHWHEPHRELLYSPGALVGIGAVTGILLPFTITPLITPAVPKEFSLYLFPGFNTAFILSSVAIAAGALLFIGRGIWLRPAMNLPIPFPSGARAYNGIVAGVEWVADQLLKTQNGKLRYYLVVIMGSVALLMLASGTVVDVARGQNVTFDLQGASDILELVLVFLAIGATFGSIIFRDHLAAALSLGVMGYAVGGIFMLEPAPDVALVQFLVETLGTVLVIIMIGRISSRRRKQAINVLWDSSRRGVWRDAFIATVTGVTVGLFALTAVTNRPDRTTIAEWHIENTYAETGVVDVVSATLADFRATDTLIEIAVFSIAALGVLTLLTLGQAKNGDKPALSTQVNGNASSANAKSPLSTPTSRAVTAFVLPFAILISFTHILYAGDRPGDGFTAGVVSGLGVALWYIVYGYTETKHRLAWLQPWWLIGAGLSIAMVNALLPLIFGREFFAITKIAGFDAPAGLHIASTLIFEIGIYLAVFGGSSLIMEAIAHPEEVSEGETREMRAVELLDPDSAKATTDQNEASKSQNGQETEVEEGVAINE